MGGLPNSIIDSFQKLCDLLTDAGKILEQIADKISADELSEHQGSMFEVDMKRLEETGARAEEGMQRAQESLHSPQPVEENFKPAIPIGDIGPKSVLSLLMRHSISENRRTIPLLDINGLDLERRTILDPKKKLVKMIAVSPDELKFLWKSCNPLTQTLEKIGIEIRDEDHGKAIFVFTVVTKIFLPLSFVTSYFGMNFVDLRETNWSQNMFWAVAGPTTFAIVTTVLIIAYKTEQLKDILGSIITRKRQRRQLKAVDEYRLWVETSG
ncbi:hypothetical protein IWX90DRAFT_488186 [Phyllosticta citrichinensis]|uniref:Uncharacterized protein n=1 Tax=Phyllosticta citrichinensis TaxID=1130410 RepID=A0ABR1XNC1_9PEZI